MIKVRSLVRRLLPISGDRAQTVVAVIVTRVESTGVVLRRPAMWTFVITVLGTGALLDALDRLGLHPTRSLAVVCGLVAFALSSVASQSDRVSRFAPAQSSGGRSRMWVVVVAATVSAVLLVSDLVRFTRRGGHSGFPIWLSDLYHEDNSSWISLGGNSSSVDWLNAQNFGFGVALIQGAINGISSVLAKLLDLPLASIGVPITAVGLAYVLLMVTVPMIIVPVLQIALQRSSSWLTTLGLGTAVALFLLRFMREVRDLGHLSAGLTVLALLYSARFVCSGPQVAKFSHSDPLALWCLSFSCLLWFPLRPLALVFAFIAVRLDLVDRTSGLETPRILPLSTARIRGILFFGAVLLRTFPDIRSYVSPGSANQTKALVNATGATYEAFDFFLLVGASVVFGTLVSKDVGSRLERLVLSLFVLFGVGIRFVDQLASPEFEYGSTKMLWILLPPVVFLGAIVLVRDISVPNARRHQLGAVFLGLSLLLANSTSFFGVARVLGPFIWSDVRGSFAELDNPMASDGFVQWDEPGGLDLQQVRAEIPIICVMIDEPTSRPRPLWEFEPYRCTRKVSELSAEHLRNRGTAKPALDELWKEYALLDRSLIEAVMGSLESGNDLSRDVLLLSRDGEIFGRERTIDLLAQIALSDPVTVRSQERWTGPLDGSMKHSMDTFDLDSGRIDLWVSTEVVSVVLIGEIEPVDFIVDRKPRADVAKLLGRAQLFSGLTIEHPSIGPGLRCVVLEGKQSNDTVVWSTGESCT